MDGAAVAGERVLRRIVFSSGSERAQWVAAPAPRLHGGQLGLLVPAKAPGQMAPLAGEEISSTSQGVVGEHNAATKERPAVGVVPGSSEMSASIFGG